MKSQPTILTIPEAGEMLGLSPTTIRRLISRGELKAHRVGRGIRIRSIDIDKALKPIKAYRP